MSRRPEGKNRMKRSIQNLLIFPIIIIAFMGSALLFWSFNTSTLRSSIEAETNLSSSLLKDDIEAGVSPEKIISGAADDSLSADLKHIEEKLENDNDVWIVGSDNQIYYDHISSREAYSESRLQQEILDLSLLEEAKTEGVSIRWAGENDLLLLKQHCITARPIFDSGMYLVTVNYANSAKARQRQQFTFLMVIEVILMLVMMVLVVNSFVKYRRQLIRYATTDELTNLANRKSFNSEFSEYVAADTKPLFSLFLLDIDYFKQINDNYGHAVGDHALKHLAGLISDMISETGGFAGRWGGDEFIGVLPLNQEAAHERLSQLCRQVEESQMEEGFHMTISVGVVGAGNESRLMKLSEMADAALYTSKENGRNQASVYQDGMTGAVKLVQRSEPASDFSEDAVKEEGASEADTLEPEKEEEQTLPKSSTKFKERFYGYVHDNLFRSILLGVRWMAPFVAGGGILIALAFLFDAASVDLASLSVSERANFGSITRQAAALKNLGGITFNFMLPVFAGFMAFGLAGEEAFMTGFVGGYMTIGANAGFIGAMIAGFAAGVITNEVRQFTGRLPKVVRKAAPIIIFPVFNLLLMQLLSAYVITPISNVIGNVFNMLLDSFVQTSAVSAGALSGMMMAVDMGGIINKVAYNYGVNGLLAGRTDIMASVMIGGMVPPIGIALSILLYRSRYVVEEQEQGIGAFFMGLSFITEGALPFVFSDFVRVIPACMLGSAVSGVLSMLFGCTLPAPHGGIFVLPVMGHPILYLIALAIGSLVTAVVLGRWKKPVEDLGVQNF